MDGYLSAATARLPVPDTGSVREDVVIHATNLAMFLRSREGKVITELIGEGQFDAGLAEAYRARFFAPRRQEARDLLQRGVNRGELQADLDISCCIDLLYGPIFYRLLITGETLDESYVKTITAAAFDGIKR
ncbi:hypothetical protein D3C73_784350 [compost metagenome]